MSTETFYTEFGREFGGVKTGVNAHISGGWQVVIEATEKGGISPEHNAGSWGSAY